MSWPPITMATQHPDNAGVPWWRKDPFIPAQDEIEELLLLFKDLPIDEYMWDWEGKYVDEAVGEKLFSRATEFFKEHPLGDDLHLTFRIPAFDVEKMHRMARAMMNILSLADFGDDIGLKRPPVTEMFLPLTTSSDQIFAVRKAFKDIAGYHRSVFHGAGTSQHDIVRLMRVTPLVEDCASLFSIRSIVEPFWDALLAEKVDLSERGVRAFLARSDPAMNAGLIPAVLAVKVALSELAAIGKEKGIAVHPIIGTGSLPFRGSVNPTYCDTFLEQYAGVRTYSIQSAFRYDYPIDDVRSALEKIRSEAPRREAVAISAEEIARLREFSDDSTALWKETIENLAPMINIVAAYVPPRRERLQHIGLFGYSRGVGKVKLPRAIGFTAALYSIGVPPEFITTGRALRLAREQNLLPLLERVYPALGEDLHHAGKYFNRENLELLAGSDPAFQGIVEDVAAIEEWRGIPLGPEKPHHVIHRNCTSTIVQRLQGSIDKEAIQAEIVEAGKIRRSLG
ncbi:MAG: phosphoenolpyruvate carboxylase [Patescibacteria group bacterium]